MLPFKNILIPVDQAEHACMSVEKAFELCALTTTTIHLVSAVQTGSNWNRSGIIANLWNQLANVSAARQATERQLSVLSKKIKALYPSSIVKKALIGNHPFSTHLSQYIHQQAIDLVIFVKDHSHHSWSYTSQKLLMTLAKDEPTPILTITPGSLNHAIKSILLPVHDSVPDRRIRAALEFAKQYNAQVHLVTLLDSNDSVAKARVDAFYLTYKMLAECGHSPHYKILQGRDSAELLLHYAGKIKADLVLVTPEKKSSFPFFPQHSFTDLLHPLSALQVLMLKPLPF
jgi:hypothetical protein